MLQQAMLQQAQAQLYAQATAPTGGWVTNTVTMVPTAGGVSYGAMAVQTAATTTLANTVMNSLYAAQGQQMAAWDTALVRDTLRLMGECAIADGEPCRVTLPDGGVLEVDADGSYRINDKDAKVIYRANRMRDFNSFINASDKLELFIKFCGALGVRQDEMLNIPIKLFIGWLVIEAARADGEQPDVDLLEGIHQHVRPRCTGCGRFIPRKLVARKITFCRPVCLERELAA